MKRVACATALFLAVFAPPAAAIRVSGLYQAEVVVADQTRPVRAQGIVSALREVLVKLTGDRFAPSGAAAAPVLGNAEGYVQQYRYREVTVPPAAEGQPASRELHLWVQFDQDALDRDLRGRGIPVWGAERPSTLLWIVIRDAQGTRWLTPDDDPLLFSVINERAGARGITLISPLLDLQDTGALQTSDVWGGFRTPIMDASARYQTDAVLSGAVESSGNGIWEGRWIAFLGDQSTTWSSQADIADEMLEEGVDGMADILANRFAQAVNPGAVDQLTISVSGVNNVDQYARVLKYLESLNAVSDLQVVHVAPGQLSIRLTAHGGEAALSQSIVLGRILEPVAGGSGSYRYLP